MESPTQDQRGSRSTAAYSTFALVLAASFAVMYFVMYTMIAKLDDFYLNLGNVYMTAMMIAPMALIMLVGMKSMFPSRAANAVVVVAALVIFAFSWYGMRAILVRR